MKIGRSSYCKWLNSNPINRQPESDFTAKTYNEKWLTDVTEFKYGINKKPYLSAILDLGDKHIVAWILGHNNNNHFETYDELERAIAKHIHYYNYEKYQESLNNITPMEYHAYLDAA